MRGRKKNIILIIMFITSLILFFFGMLFIKKGFNNFHREKVSITENGTIDYRVLLKPNKFFETPYLGKGQVYITSLIDDIDIDLKYSADFGENKNGGYRYGIKGVISADLQNSTNNYWQKEYTLTNEKEQKLENQDTFEINERLTIDYEKYNNLLTEFKKQYALNINGYLKIYLYVQTAIESKNPEKPLTTESLMSLSIPLTKATIEVPIEINAPTGEKVLSSGVVYSKEIKYLLYKLSGSASLLVSTLMIVYVVLVIVKSKEKQYFYIREINRILKTYDPIIVNVKEMPSLKGLRLIEVSEFNELLDAHSEVRLPINYCNYKDRAEFVLCDNQMAWRYVIEKEEIYEKRK